MPSDRTRPYIPRSSKRTVNTSIPLSSTTASVTNGNLVRTSSTGPGPGPGISGAMSLGSRSNTMATTRRISPLENNSPQSTESTDEDEDEQDRLIHNRKPSPHKDSPLLPQDNLNPKTIMSRNLSNRSSPSPHPTPVGETDGLGPSPGTGTRLTRQLTRLTGPIQVQTNLQIFRVHKIDSSSEEFTIDCGITFIWKDPFLAVEAEGKYFASHPAVVRHNPRTGRSDYELWPDNFIVGQTVFDPAWKIMNCSDLEVIKNFTTILNSEEGVVHNYLHIRATIYQTLDLHSFPFDHQEMTIRIQSEHSTQVVQFIAMTDRLPRLYDNNIASEWNINCDSMKLHFDMDNRPAASGSCFVIVIFTLCRCNLCGHEVHI